MKIETDWLRKWCRYSPQAIALTDYENRNSFTYYDLNQMSDRLAAFLRDHYEIKAGDRICGLAPNAIEYFFLFFAAQRLGAILVPINFRLASREVEHILSDCRPKLVVLHQELTETWQSLAEKYPGTSLLSWSDLSNALKDNSTIPDVMPLPSDPERVCLILYTSGTTGFPKGAMINHRMLFWNSINTGLRLNINQSDVAISFLPLFHTSGWNVLNTPFWHHGAKIVFLAKFDASKILEICERERVTILFGVPTTMAMMRQSPSFESVNLSSVRYAIVGGEPMPVPLIEEWGKKGIPIRQGYGLTEFGPNVFSLNEEDSIRKRGSIGFANFYIETRIVDPEGNDVPPGEVGELILQGPSQFAGYWENSEASANTLKNGWLWTGDLVRQDDEGYFYVVGRRKDMFISGGENVYPAEVEQYLSTHPAVREVAVVGVPDVKWGEVGKAFISLKDEKAMTIEELSEFCKGALAKYKIPRYLQILPELPKGDSGKILKRRLMEETI